MEKHITSQHTDLKWERLRLQYLRKCRRTLYTELLATDKLNEHLGEINEQAAVDNSHSGIICGCFFFVQKKPPNWW